MQTILRILAALGIALSAASVAAGLEIFVSNAAGDDRFTGRQPRNMADGSGPVRTITRALQLAGQGDRIVLENSGEPYRESFSLVGKRHSGYPFRRFVIEGNGAILDGSAPVPPIAWEHYRKAVFRFLPPYKYHQQLFLGGRPATRVFADPLSGRPPEMEAGDWCLHGGAIYFCVERMKLPEDYPLSYARSRVGISLLYVRDVEIRDLVVQGFQLDGINAHNSARGVTLTRVVCRGNARAGITAGGASILTLADSLAGDNGDAQVLALPYSELHVHNTELLGNTAPGLVNRNGTVYVEGERIEGGLEEFLPEATAQPDQGRST
jgi:hypothetical protein